MVVTNRRLAKWGVNSRVKKIGQDLWSRPIDSELGSVRDQNSYSAEIRIERGAE
jgi:hypothetical protein